MAKSAADAAVDSFVIDLRSDARTAPKQSSKLEEIEKRRKALEELKKEKPAPASSDISDSEKRLRDLERDTSTLAVSDSSSGSSSSSRSAKMEELLKRKAEAEARIRSVSEGKITYVPTTGTSARISGMEAEKRRMAGELSGLPSTAELLSEKDSAAKKLDRLQRGIGIHKEKNAKV